MKKHRAQLRLSSIFFRPEGAAPSSSRQRFTVEDYLQPERLNLFYRAVRGKPVAKPTPPPEAPDKEESFWGDMVTDTGGIFDPQKCQPQPNTGGIFDPQKCQLQPNTGGISSKCLTSVVSCNVIVPTAARSRRSRRPRRFPRGPHFTKFEVGMSPVRHLITYAQECRSLHPSLQTYLAHFGQTMGDSVQGWYQLPSIQRINDWAELQDAFLLRFLSKQRYRMHQTLLSGLQFNGEDTRHYVNVWRDDLWSDPLFLLQPEELGVQECMSTAYFPHDIQTSSFVRASEYAESHQLQATYIPHQAQIFEEGGIRYKLEYLRQANSVLLHLFPGLRHL